eukprot:TRINITY_DN12836_c0_g1_i1.p1 TRINITY_DN12836_c0_g1~~TRINITY_DN12836_c0_g1_i1.p1  ORF type:complete len:360 (+),score=55.68 TRINITY_DN12836_c0_g1_i1:124-1080(+)
MDYSMDSSSFAQPWALSQRSRPRRGQIVVRWEPQEAVLVGITTKCSIVVMHEKTKEILETWRYSQIKAFSLRSRDSFLFLDLGSYSRDGLVLFSEKRDVARIYTRFRNLVLSLKEQEEDSQSRMEQLLRTYNMKLHPVQGDGNCQMRAVADQLWNKESKHDIVRKAVGKWLRANAKYSIRENGKAIATLQDFLQTERFKTWKDYCTYVEQDRNWGDHLTLIATCEVYLVKINLLSNVEVDANIPGGTSAKSKTKEASPWTEFKPASDRAVLRQEEPLLLCHWHERHYGSLQPVTEAEATPEEVPTHKVVNPHYIPPGF